MYSTTEPNFGIRVMVLKEDKVLLGKNKQSTHAAVYMFPGGHLEYMESFEDCARRELKEECDIEVENIRFQSISNIAEYKPYHNVHITLIADWKSGEPAPLEPEKVESWNWYDLNNLPQPLFKNAAISLESYKVGKNYFDIEK